MTLRPGIPAELQQLRSIAVWLCATVCCARGPLFFYAAVQLIVWMWGEGQVLASSSCAMIFLLLACVNLLFIEDAFARVMKFCNYTPEETGSPKRNSGRRNSSPKKRPSTTEFSPPEPTLAHNDEPCGIHEAATKAAEKPTLQPVIRQRRLSANSQMILEASSFSDQGSPMRKFTKRMSQQFLDSPPEPVRQDTDSESGLGSDSEPESNDSDCRERENKKEPEKHSLHSPRMSSAKLQLTFEEQCVSSQESRIRNLAKRHSIEQLKNQHVSGGNVAEMSKP